MKYRDLIQYDPIDEIIKFSKLSSDDYRTKIVKDFVCSKAYEEYIIPQICAKLDLSSTIETKGIQIVGNYGTGKSHLMSLFTIIAEDERYLDLLQSQKAKERLATIAGKYKVYRFELGNSQELWDIVTYKIDMALAEWGVSYSISDDTTPASYSEKLEKMMAAFEEVYPDKGFMIVIDEMLSYLKGRSQPDKLNRDLAVLQALGQMSDRTHFRMVFGVQELIYTTPEFQFAKDMLSHVNERYADLTIQKEDVQFIVQQRLLQKNEHQRAEIRAHLKNFTKMFPQIDNNLETFVNLFPVHPSYFENFSLIRIGKSQREVLKTLSKKFASIMDEDVPSDQPGLICYDSYWQDMLGNVDLKADPNVSRVSDITALVDQKIEDNFTRGLAPKKPLAHRIVAAAAIKMLQADLSHANGVTAESLANDLCQLDATADDYDELVDLVYTHVLNKIVTATIGQYFEKGDNQEYHLRIEGGVNYEQKVRDYAAQMSDSQRDEYFYSFLAEVLPMEGDTYRTTFRIWEHSIEWRSHHCYRKGYIFMGNPNERSTTQPEQHFYLYFMPIFDGQSYKRDPSASDSIYFLMNALSDDFKQQVTLYGSAAAQEGSASSDEKPRYKQLREKFFKESRDIFNSEFLSATIVEYMGEQHPMQGMPGAVADSKIDAVSGVASYIMNQQFNAENEHYPKFDALSSPLSLQNRKGFVDLALKKIADPLWQSRNGEAMLMALGLWANGRLDTNRSQYARSLKQKLENKGGQVVNRDEILRLFYEPTNEYVSCDFGIEADLEMVVMATMTALGEIEVVLRGGNHITASSIQSITSLNPADYYNFQHICQPKGLNIPLIRELMLGLVGTDRTAELDDPHSSVFADLVSAAKQMEERVVRMQHRISGDYRLAGNIEVITQQQAQEMNILWDRLRGMCNQMQRYNTKAKMRNIPWTADVVRETMTAIKQSLIDTEQTLKEMQCFKDLAAYFRQALGNVVAANSYDPTLHNDIQQKLDGIAAMAKASQSERNRYIADMEAVRNRYAAYYMDCYTKAHICEMDYARKNALLQRDECLVCHDVHEASFINPALFDSWKQNIDRLRLADPSVTLESIRAVATAPDGFSPSAVMPQLPSIGQLADELTDIYNGYLQQFRDALDDPSARRNREMLSADEQSLLQSFEQGSISLTHQYARPLAAVISKMQQHFERIAITHDELAHRFSRPMKVEEAMQAFRALIEEQSRGKRPEDVRIIIK